MKIILEFKEELKKYQKIINEELEKYLIKDDCLEKTLNDSMEYSLMAGGKRIRPILVLSTYSLFKDEYDECMAFAVAIEMIHNASLIHDDLPEIDNDDFRHGKPTNHKKFSQSTALLAGDCLINKAYIALSDEIKYSVENQYMDIVRSKVQAFNEFSKAVDRMIVGEYVDTELERKKISKEDLEYIHENKTGALLKLCVRMGAIIGGAKENELQRLTRYSEKIGLAFQVKDDILSEEGDEKVLGKPVGNDKEMGKSTYVSYYGIDGAKEKLNNIIDEAIEELKAFDDRAGFLRNLALYIKNRSK